MLQKKKKIPYVRMMTDYIVLTLDYFLLEIKLL